MKAIFTQLNILNESHSKAGKPVAFLVINNVDGTPRWICNAESKKPLFLNFYMVSSWRSWVFSTLIKLVFFLQIQKWVFTVEHAELKKTEDQHQPVVDFFAANWAIFTGTVGPNNKILIVEEKNETIFFYKVAHTPKSLQLIDNEVKTINTLNNLGIKSFTYPEAKKVNALTVQLQDISALGNRENEFTSMHQNALQELYQKTHKVEPLSSVSSWTDSLSKLSDLENTTDIRIPKGLVRKLRWLASTLTSKTIETTLCHADFTPWNMYAGNTKLAIYDWELAQENMPLGFDAFHYVIQKGILVDRKPWTAIRTEMEAHISPAQYTIWKNSNQFETYLKWYLFINTVNYLTIYAEQTEWHAQISWLISTWNEAISETLQVNKEPRSLIVIDVFDFLHPKNYAAIKFPNTRPEELSAYSDIDLCVQKQDVSGVVSYLKKHPLTHHVQVEKRSHMLSVQLFLFDASVLSIDLIWSLTRKSYVMLDAKEVLKNSIESTFGIKHMCAMDTARYIALFYGLNNANIPPKYQVYDLVMANGTSNFDQLLYQSYMMPKEKKQEMISFLRQTPNNSWVNRAIHAIGYAFDTIKFALFSRGLTITFSGVDGAGKSTIIENVRHEIEKKLRKKVIVLRHRPSLLPILSAITKGKAQAEKDAASTLPRQGSNKSSISSALRFGYYYFDYLVGQFYVYLKYVRRGYVVLYDRYYFDFINDSKRSNIELPKALIKAAYFFVLEPDLNFFLFADPVVILKRKQELDPPTITRLTNAYLELFEDLNAREARYFSIENVALKDTMKIIMNKTLAKVA